MASVDVTLIGYGAIGKSLLARLHAAGAGRAVRVTHVVVRDARVASTQAQLDAAHAPLNVVAPRAVSQVPASALLALECAGHEALTAHVVPALQRGCECAVLSVGALAEAGFPEQLENAAKAGGTQVHLLSGAIGGIDALGAARLAGLTSVTYTGRKPPSAWAPAPGHDGASNQALALANITQVAIILEASARVAARQYPKNANVAATVALAGLGLDATQVRLLADPSVSDNVHEIHAVGAFGEMKIEMRGKPLADNPKTSALTVLSALRFLNNRASALTV